MSSRFHAAVNVASGELQRDAVVLAHWFAEVSKKKVAAAMNMDEAFDGVMMGQSVNLLMPLYVQLKGMCRRRLYQFYEDVEAIGQEFMYGHT